MQKIERISVTRLQIAVIAFVFSLALVSIPISLAHAAADVAEDFDSYTAGSSLNGANGGTGWSGSWSATSVTTDNAPAGGQGGKAAHMSTPGLDTGQATRSFSSMPAGVVTFRIYTSINQFNNTHSYALFEGSSNRAIVRWSNNYPNPGTAGNLEAWNGDTSSYETIATGVTANAWHTIKIRFGQAANKYAVAVDTGDYSSNKGTNGAFTGIDKFGWANSSSQTFDSYVDDVQVTQAVTSAGLPVEDFDSYASGNSLSGANGGIGWSSAWSVVSTTVAGAPAGGQGGNAGHMSTPGLDTGSASRSFSGLAVGTTSFRIYSTINQFNNTHSYSLLEGAANRIIVRWNNSYPNLGVAGNLDAWNGDTSSYETIATGVTANAWHTITVRFGQTVNKYAVSVDGGAFSSNKGTNGAFSTINKFSWDNSSSQTFDSYVDDIGR